MREEVKTNDVALHAKGSRPPVVLTVEILEASQLGERAVAMVHDRDLERC